MIEYQQNEFFVEFNIARNGYIVARSDGNGLTMTILSRGYKDKSNAIRKLEEIKKDFENQTITNN